MAKKLKSEGATIYVVAVGSYINGIDEMVKVASDPYQHIFRVKTVGQFYEVTRLILKKGFSGQPLGPYNPPCSYGKWGGVYGRPSLKVPQAFVFSILKAIRWIRMSWLIYALKFFYHVKLFGRRAMHFAQCILSPKKFEHGKIYCTF